MKPTLILRRIRRNGICQFSWQSKGIYISIEELTPEDVVGLNMAELKVFLQEQLRNAYDIGSSDQSIRSGLMREAERFLSFSKSMFYGAITCSLWMLFVNALVFVDTDRKIL